MKTSVERVDDTTVKLSVTVEADRVSHAMEHAAAKLASEVKVPGFRPGKAPRKVLEARLGKGVVEQEALREALPAFYSEAVLAESLQAVGPPEFDVDTFEDGKDAEFTATVEVLPEFELPELAELQIAHPEWEVTEEELEAALEQLRDRFAEVETVSRPAGVGDHVLVTVTGTRGGQPVEEASAEDVLYEISDPDQSPSELDRSLVGAEAGAIVKFTDTLGPDYGELAGAELDFTAIVKEVKAKKLPELDDDFAITASEFDTIDELRDELREQVGREKRAYATAALRGKVVEAVCERVEVALPSSLVDQELRVRLNRMAMEAQQHGLSFEQYLEAVGVPAEELREKLEPDASATVKAQLVVDAFGRAQGLEVTQDDLGGEIMRQAARLGQPPQEVAEFLTQSDRIGALVSDAFRRKAIDRMVEEAQVLSAPPPEPEPEPEPEAEVEAGPDPTAEQD